MKYLKRLLKDILILIKGDNTYIIISIDGKGNILISHTLEEKHIEGALKKSICIFTHLPEYTEAKSPLPNHVS